MLSAHMLSASRALPCSGGHLRGAGGAEQHPGGLGPALAHHAAGGLVRGGPARGMGVDRLLTVLKQHAGASARREGLAVRLCSRSLGRQMVRRPRRLKLATPPAPLRAWPPCPPPGGSRPPTSCTRMPRSGTQTTWAQVGSGGAGTQAGCRATRKGNRGGREGISAVAPHAGTCACCSPLAGPPAAVPCSARCS